MNSTQEDLNVASFDSRSARSEANPVDILVTIGEQKRLVFGITLGAAILGLVVSLILPPVYKAKTVMMPPQQDKSTLALGDLNALTGGLSGAIGMKTPDDMYVGLLNSDNIADSLIVRFKLEARYGNALMSEARETLHRKVKISSDKKSGFITIEVSDRSPNFSAELANAYVDELRKLLEHLNVTDAQRRRLFFQQQIDKTLTHLSQAEVAFDKARQKSGVVSLDGEVASSIRASADLRARIAADEIRLQSMRTYATDENPDVQRLLAELKAMRGQLQTLEQGGGDDATSNPTGDPAALANIRAYREVKYQEAILDQLRKQLELAQVDAAREGPLVQQIDVAIPADKRASPKRRLVLLGSAAFGLVLGILAALARLALRSNDRLSSQISRIRYAWRLNA